MTYPVIRVVPARCARQAADARVDERGCGGEPMGVLIVRESPSGTGREIAEALASGLGDGAAVAIGDRHPLVPDPRRRGHGR